MTGRIWIANSLLTLVAAGALLTRPSVAIAQLLFHESWEHATPGLYVPDTFIDADSGPWNLGRGGEFPECGPEPSAATITSTNGNQSLTLTSCADGIWLTAVRVWSGVPFNNGLSLAFTETGSVVEPASCDAVDITLAFDTGRAMEYVLQRGTWWTSPPGGERCEDDRIDFPGPVILLGEQDGTYGRDLRSDVLSVGLPLPHAVTIFELDITSGGSATIDDIKFSVSSVSPSPTPTPTATATPTSTPTQTPTATPTPTMRSGPAPATCVGDCNDDGTVTVDEILTVVNIALGNAEATRCKAGDANSDGQITIDEILTAVHNALNGCAGGGTS